MGSYWKLITNRGILRVDELKKNLKKQFDEISIYYNQKVKEQTDALRLTVGNQRIFNEKKKKIEQKLNPYSLELLTIDINEIADNTLYDVTRRITGLEQDLSHLLKDLILCRLNTEVNQITMETSSAMKDFAKNFDTSIELDQLTDTMRATYRNAFKEKIDNHLKVLKQSKYIQDRIANVQTDWPASIHINDIDDMIMKVRGIDRDITKWKENLDSLVRSANEMLDLQSQLHSMSSLQPTPQDVLHAFSDRRPVKRREDWSHFSGSIRY